MHQTLPPPTSITIDLCTTVHGTGNVVAAHSAGASQQVSVTADQRTQVVQVADALSGMLDALGLAPQNTAEARQVVDDLRTESAAPAPDRSRLRKLLDLVTVIGAAESALHKRVGQATPPVVDPDLLHAPAETWARLTQPQRRAALRVLFGKITVRHGGPAGGPRADPT